MRTLDWRLAKLERQATRKSSAVALLQQWYRERHGKPSRLPIRDLVAQAHDSPDDGGALMRFLRGEQ